MIDHVPMCVKLLTLQNDYYENIMNVLSFKISEEKGNSVLQQSVRP